MLIKVWKCESGDIIAIEKEMENKSPTISNLLVI
jgi:hypothetical protein